MSTVVTDVNGIKQLVPVASGAGGDLLLDNDAALSALRTADRASINANAAAAVLNAAGVAANLAAIGSNDADILALENVKTALSVTNYETVGNGTTDDYAALVAAEAAAFEASRWLLFPPGTYLINSDITFRVPVLFAGGILRLAATKIATFNQPYMNPSMQKCFDEQGRTPNQAGGVKIARNSPQDTVRPEDWGAKGDDATLNNEVPIQQAIDSVTYSSTTVGKVGVVEFHGHTYLCNDSIYVGYDWIGYPADWADPDGAAATTCHRGVATTAQSRMVHVILRGIGSTVFEYRGATANRKYLIYYSGAAQTKGFDTLANITVDLQWNCRGIFLAYRTYSHNIGPLYIFKSLHVGLDLVECFGDTLSNVFFYYTRGIALRTFVCGGMTAVSVISAFARGNKDSYFPSPDEVVIKAAGLYQQTSVWERAVFDIGTGVASFNNLMIENAIMGTALHGTASGLTFTVGHHGLEDGDPIYIFDDGTATAVDVASTNSFTVDDAFLAAGNQLVYRRCSAITRANPGVFTCQNHGLAEGQWIKIVCGSGAGMTDAALDGEWLRVNYLTDDTFSLWTTWDDDAAIPFTVPLDTSLFAAPDGTEYIVSSAAGITIGGTGGSLANTYIEGNSILRAKIVVNSDSTGMVIKGMYVNDSAEGLCDWAVELRDRQIGLDISGITGDGIEDAVVKHHLPAMPTYGYAVGNKLYNNRTYKDGTTGTLVPVRWGARAENNNVDGVITPVNVTDTDVTPSVVSSVAFTQRVFAYGGVLVFAAAYNDNCTYFDDGVDGQLLRTHFEGAAATIIHDAAKIVTITGGNLTPGANDELVFRRLGGIWYQV